MMETATLEFELVYRILKANPTKYVLYPRKVEVSSFWVRLRVRLLGPKFLKWERLGDGALYTAIWLCYCKLHGFYEDYEHGFTPRFLCPTCLSEEDWNRGR